MYAQFSGTFALTLATAVGGRWKVRLAFARAKMQSAKHKVHSRVIFFGKASTVGLLGCCGYSCGRECVSEREGVVFECELLRFFYGFGQNNPQPMPLPASMQFPFTTQRRWDPERRNEREKARKGVWQQKCERAGVKSLGENQIALQHLDI